MKKVISVLLVLIFSFSIVLTSCQNNKSSQSKKTEAGTAQKPTERVKLRIFMSGGGSFIMPPDIDPNNNKWANVFKDAFPEVDFDFIMPGTANANEKKTMMVASGDFPDMMVATQLEIINWSEQGIIIPVDDIMKKHYPNINKFVTPEDMRVGQYNGKQWGMPVPLNSLQNPTMTYVRKDWLDKLSLKVPVTVDDAYDTMKAFVTRDPDGNGKDDTYGTGGTKNLGNFNGFFLPFDVMPGWWSRVNGKLVPDNVRPEMKEALAFIRKLFAENLIDKDTLVQNPTQMEQKATQGYGFLTMATWGVNGRVNINVQKQSGGEFVPLDPLKGPKGVQWINRNRNVGRMHVVSSNCKNPEYPAKLLNWLLEEDKTKSWYHLNADTINCGEVGVNAAVTGRFITDLAEAALNEEGKKNQYRYNYRFMDGSMNFLKDEDQFLHAEEQVKAGLIYKYFPYDRRLASKYPHYDDKIVSGPVAAELQSQLDTYFDEIKMKIVTGAEPIEAFDRWVDYYYKNGGQKIDDETNKLNPAK